MKLDTLYCEDNLHLLPRLPANFIDLIYCDILYGTGRDFKFYKDIKADMGEVFAFYTPRIREMHRVLKETGSIYIHCDPRTSHWIRLILDEIFGYGNFRNEIVWRMGWVSGFKTLSHRWVRNHDSLLYYVKDCQMDFTFNKSYLPYPEGYERWKGRKKGKGYAIEDVWGANAGERINSLAVVSFAKENCNFPNQKPKALLKRIILASSNPGDLVADFFCGSGTTLVVAKELDRKYIGCDSSEGAIKIAKKRLRETVCQKQFDFGEPEK